MTRKRRRKLSRRQFIKESAGVGLAATLPGLLVGCGDNDGHGTPAPTLTPTPIPASRERRTLHFDLSHNDPIGDAFLVVLNSASYRARLQPHDAASRQRFRESTPELRYVPDDELTHYLANVDLPADALQLVTVIGTANGEPALLGAYIHIPTSTLADYAARAGQGAAALPVALLNRYHTASTVAAMAGTLEFSNAYVTPRTTAVALCFHHPEVMNLNTQLGANTLIGYIENLPADCTDPSQGCKFVDALAFWIATHSPATTTPGGWATLLAQTYADGKPVLDRNGNQVYRYDLTDDTRDNMARPVQEVLKAVFNDQQYEGSNWNATKGLVSVEQAAPGGASRLPGLLQDNSFIVQATLPVGSTHNGIEFVGLDVANAASRSVQLTIKNRYLRWLRAYAQYFTPEGMALPVMDPNGNDTSRAKFITEITSNNQIMGIPLMGNDVSSTNVAFQIPTAASKARIIIGSLGLGGEAFCPEALLGSALTLGFNIAIPTLLLSYGIGEAASSGISALANNQELRMAIVGAVKDFIATTAPSYGIGIYGSATSKDAICFISAVANSIISALLSSATILAQYLLPMAVAEDAVTAVPFVGWALKGLEILAAIVAIAVSIGEVLASKALTYNDVTLSLDIQVTIEHDPDDFRFPPEADVYEVTATLAKSLVYKTSGTIEPPGGQRTDPIVATINNVPSGGKVTIDVVLKSSDGWIAATASFGPVDATPEAASDITLAVKNKLVPLTAQTQYQHDLKLEYEGGAHVWKQTAAPTATVSALACATNATLCELGQITVSPRTGMIGYAWRTGGLGVAQCNGGPGGVLSSFQNVFAAASPDSALKFAGCGFALPVGLTYDPKGPPSGAGNNFYFEPAADGDGYYLRSVTLDAATPFNLNQATNWGRFTQVLNAVAVHPTGYVVGVAAATHKLEILELPDASAPDSMPPLSPWATMRSGLGTRPGLMNTPVAVTVAGGAVIVLEQGNRRLQAFDLTANPVDHFASKKNPIALLMSETASVVYVGLASDALGYLYVLSYVNNGVSPADYRLDIYQPDGTFLLRNTGIAAGSMTVDPFRTLYALNYGSVGGAPRIEPSLSQWIPSTAGT